MYFICVYGCYVFLCYFFDHFGNPNRQTINQLTIISKQQRRNTQNKQKRCKPRLTNLINK